MAEFCEYIGFATTLMGPCINSITGMALPICQWCPLAQSRAVPPPVCAEVPGTGMLEEPQGAA